MDKPRKNICEPYNYAPHRLLQVPASSVTPSQGTATSWRFFRPFVAAPLLLLLAFTLWRSCRQRTSITLLFPGVRACLPTSDGPRTSPLLEVLQEASAPVFKVSKWPVKRGISFTSTSLSLAPSRSTFRFLSSSTYEPRRIESATSSVAQKVRAWRVSAIQNCAAFTTDPEAGGGEWEEQEEQEEQDSRFIP